MTHWCICLFSKLMQDPVFSASLSHLPLFISASILCQNHPPKQNLIMSIPNLKAVNSLYTQQKALSLRYKAPSSTGDWTLFSFTDSRLKPENLVLWAGSQLKISFLPLKHPPTLRTVTMKWGNIYVRNSKQILFNYEKLP